MFKWAPWIILQGALKNFTAPSNVLSTSKQDTTSSCANSSHSSRLPSGDIPLRKGSCLSSTQVIEKLHPGNEGQDKLSKPYKQGMLKFRLKTGPDTTRRTNAALYSGLGLEDDSQSSSLESSPDSSEGVPLSCDAVDNSPSRILQVENLMLLSVLIFIQCYYTDLE